MSYADREKRIQYLREYRRKKGLAGRIKRPLMTLEERRAYHRSYYADNRARVSAIAAKKEQRRKLEALSGYGSKCNICGEVEPEFLTLDHVADDGFLHRREISQSIYVWAVTNNFPDTLQCLCFSCNIAKGLKQKPEGKSKSAATFRKQRAVVMSHYGNKCSCCSEADPLKLALDHVHGDGHIERKIAKGARLWSTIIKDNFPTRYRILCHNCNHSARMGNGMCLHLRQAPLIDQYRKAGIIHPLHPVIDVSAKTLEELRKEKTDRDIASMLADGIFSCQLPPPYKRVSHDAAAKDFLALVNCTPHIEGSQTCGMRSSNRFHEKNLWKTVSPMGRPYDELWHTSKEFLVKVCRGLALAKGHGISNINLRRYVNLNVRLPSQFRPAVARALYEWYAPSGGSILDPCSGWGDRLAGFWASSMARYVGVDPNPTLHPAYEKQAAFYKQLVGKKDVTFIQSTIENADLGNEQFDFGFTSPPYFDAEKYVGEESSYLKYPTYPLWREGFLKPLIQKMQQHCNVFALNVPDKLVLDVKAIAKEAGAVLGSENWKYLLPKRPIRGSLPRSEPILIFHRS